ncbi:MAG TPA: aminotransferase, partial [bacterium]|nr:aminotransferase [bacterium]
MKSIKSIPQSEPLITAKDRKAVNDYLKGGGWLTEHTKTKEFEDGITKFIGSKYCSVVPNGTLGLTLALMALGIKGEVIVPAFTMIASVNAVKLAGAKPVMADIDLDTWCLDLDNLPITDKTQAIMVVHLNGRSPDMDKLVKICKEKHLYLIEDSCQAFGAVELKGDIAVYSLSPHKIITTGQGGLVVTNSQKISEKVRRLKDFGRLDGGEDVFPELGFNFKFTDLQAVIG